MNGTLISIEYRREQLNTKNYTLRWLYHGKEPQSQEMANATLQSVQTYINILKGWGCMYFKLVDDTGNEYEISRMGTISALQNV